MDKGDIYITNKTYILNLTKIIKHDNYKSHFPANVSNFKKEKC